MKISNVSGSLALLELAARYNTVLSHARRVKTGREPVEKVNVAEKKEKGGTATEKGPTPPRSTGPAKR